MRIPTSTYFMRIVSLQKMCVSFWRIPTMQDYYEWSLYTFVYWKFKENVIVSIIISLLLGIISPRNPQLETPLFWFLFLSRPKKHNIYLCNEPGNFNVFQIFAWLIMRIYQEKTFDQTFISVVWSICNLLSFRVIHVCVYVYMCGSVSLYHNSMFLTSEKLWSCVACNKSYFYSH